MNGSRSTLMRKGYLLTALFAAVLLAASSGTAWAQSIGFASTSATLTEGASPATTTPAPITIRINISDLPANDPMTPDVNERETALGVITLDHNADLADNLGPGETVRSGDNLRVWVDGESSALDEARIIADSGIMEHSMASGKYGLDTGSVIPYDNNGVITLVIIDPGGDGNWVDNSFTMSIKSDTLGVSPSPGSAKVSVTDTSVQPTVSFSKTSVSLTEGTQTSTGNTVSVALGVGAMETAPDGMEDLTNTIRFTSSPKGAAVAMCDDDSEDDVIALSPINGISAVTDGAMGDPDTWEVTGQAGNISAANFGIQACGDMSGFNDEMVTLSFDAMSLTGEPTGYGNVAAGADLVVTVQSEGEAVPTVSFATTSIAIDEGGTNTVAIIADGKLGPEVGSVMVSMSGDAMLSLWQGMDMLEAGADGMYAVDLGGSANTILTISADSDRALEDGMTSSATLTIESANGADIGDRDSLTVTVSRLHRRCCAAAARAVAPGPVPDGRRRAAVSSAQRIAPSSGVGGTVFGKGDPARMRRVPFRFL